MKNEKSMIRYLILTELEKAISDGDLDAVKKLNHLIDYTVENQMTWRGYYDNDENSTNNTNLVIIASKHNKVNIMEYLFHSNSGILKNVYSTTILPDDEDEEHHNAFYYAIRSGNTELLETLINKWPDNYFAGHSEELDEILSEAYEELKLKNVALSDEISIFVEKKLISLRFLSNDPQHVLSFKGEAKNVRERVELILENISFLKRYFPNTEAVDQRFLFLVKSIALNIYTLKRQVKSVYGILPCEEMEFCLVAFVSSYTKRQEINVFYRAILTKRKILHHLENFAEKLEDVKGFLKGYLYFGKLTDLAKIKREDVVEEIISNFPEFEDIYKDYRQIRDIHSLEKIRDNIKLALSVDPVEIKGQFIIIKVLQVFGEYLKNTMESPNLSSNTSELLLLTFQKNSRDVILDLRNSRSHADSLCTRMQIKETADINFFVTFQNDAKRVDGVIADILLDYRISTIRILLKQIINSDNSDEIKQVVGELSTIGLDELITENSQISEHEKLEKLLQELGDLIVKNSLLENKYIKNLHNNLFDIMNSIINCVDDFNPQSDNTRILYISGLKSLKNLIVDLSDNKTSYTDIEGIKLRANDIFKSIAPKLEPRHLKKIANLLKEIHVLRSVSTVMQYDQLDEMNRLTCEIFRIVEFGTDDLQLIGVIRETLNECDLFIPVHKQIKSYNVTEEAYNNQLAIKLYELKGILKDDSLIGPIIERLSFYKSDKKLQALVEMLVLDIMSILGTSKRYLENNLLFIEDNTPVLTGKCLRNHLAHDNTIIDVLLSDPSTAVILNAEVLTEENIMLIKQKIGKNLVSDEPSKVKAKYDKGFAAISNQKGMFIALKEGNLTKFKDYLKIGTDIYARSLEAWTTLHFAAKGPNLDVVKFILDQNISADVKDINGDSPLHIAAAYGRKDIVEYFVKETRLNVDEVNNRGETPLDLAVQNGHKDTVEILLKIKDTAVAVSLDSDEELEILQNDINISVFNADIQTVQHTLQDDYDSERVHHILKDVTLSNLKDADGKTPLHCAISRGQINIMKILLRNGADVTLVTVNGHTPLHLAVSKDHIEIVEVLLEHIKRNALYDIINAQTIDSGATSLHIAANNGNLDLTKSLLQLGAIYNLKNNEGKTPLDLSKDQDVNDFLKLVDELFDDANNGNIEVISKIRTIKASDFQAVTKARNNQGHTLFQVVIAKGFKNISSQLLDLLKTSDGNLQDDDILKGEVNSLKL